MFNFRLFALPLICESEFGVHEADCLKASRALRRHAAHGLPRSLVEFAPVAIDETIACGRVATGGAFRLPRGLCPPCCPANQQRAFRWCDGMPLSLLLELLGAVAVLSVLLEAKGGVVGTTHMASVGGQRSHENDAKKCSLELCKTNLEGTCNSLLNLHRERKTQTNAP